MAERMAEGLVQGHTSDAGESPHARTAPAH
ncbi:hypothetical protein BJ956_003168 [Arthrobacter psychrochitiniphilus]|nr:hypothetical protein [Arthrobacter psychrochitiniphilus]